MPIDIHGKQYLTVVERMDKLLDECGKEGYSLDTEVNVVNDKCIVKATLTLFFLKDVKGEPVPLTRTYTGHAVGSIEQHKDTESTETHAIGRALSSAGWSGGEFASANEIESWQDGNDSFANKPKSNVNSKKSIKNPSDLATDKQLNFVKKLCAEKGVDNSDWNFETMTKGECSEKIESLQS